MGDGTPSFLDRWSLVHFASGFAGKKIGLSFASVLVASTAWELYEYNGGFERFSNPVQDSTMNIISDTIMVSLGWLFG